MYEPIESEYFQWLCAKVLDSNTREYELLLAILFDTEFTWMNDVPADKHRVSDGLELRYDYLRERSIKHTALDSIPISILEVLLAFADRAAFQTDMPASDWFWTFLGNLGLKHFKHISDTDKVLIEEILYTFTWRIYEPNGYGGLFPMDHTENDQRGIEIWYQFCEYIIRSQ